MLYVVSGLVVPYPWLIGMFALWIAAVVVAVRNRRRPWFVLAVPLVAVVLWFAIVSLGGALFDWTG